MAVARVEYLDLDRAGGAQQAGEQVDRRPFAAGLAGGLEAQVVAQPAGRGRQVGTVLRRPRGRAAAADQQRGGEDRDGRPDAQPPP